ncbi:phage tail tape measure protein [Pseudomonas sp. AA27]|uniref:phage tail tape measure protein n=1 Tax=Pseudomonas sp. AA27 TaxID=2908652 RepID=UPI001F292BB7|nr:phage tail tape measure protein [Pseudomonas sp. AA27]MCF1486218.1 phage tail tape measure protein [Pseudomonas sp. AA27]
MSTVNATSRLDYILQLTDKVSAPLEKITKGISDLADGTKKLQGSLSGIGTSLAPALEMNRALADLRSLGVAEDALDALDRKALKFSIAYGENARNFVASAYKIEGAIKGLTGSQLATFTYTSNVLAKATKSDQGVMAEYVGTMYNLQKQQADAMGKGQWVKVLGGQTALAVQLFRTSGEQMKDGFKAAGASASAAGIDLAEQMAVLGSLSSTMQGSDAGGLYKAFLDNIDSASSKLGMKFTDADGHLLPMLDILGKLQGKFGDLKGAAANAKITKAFGGDAARLIGALSQDAERLRGSLDKLGKVRGLEVAERMAKGMVDPWQQLEASVMAVRRTFGQALIPILQPLMTRLVDIGNTLVRWIKLFPNITRVIGIATLTITGMSAALGALVVAVGIARVVVLGMQTAWALLNLTGLKSLAVFILHSIQCVLLVGRVLAMITVLGTLRLAMLAWQTVTWLVNAAMYANPIGVVVAGIAVLITIVALVARYWDDFKAALLENSAFQWVSSQFTELGTLFGSMSGWADFAKSAWDSITKIFRSALDGLIDMLNKIPGVNIETRFGDLPKAPEVPQLPGQVAPIGIRPITSQPASIRQLMQVPTPTPLMAPIEQIDQQRQRMTQTALNLSPASPTSVPQGGLMTQIQNTTQAQDRRMHVEKVEINTSKAMNPLELEQMMAMAVG